MCSDTILILIILSRGVVKSEFNVDNNPFLLIIILLDYITAERTRICMCLHLLWYWLGVGWRGTRGSSLSNVDLYSHLSRLRLVLSLWHLPIKWLLSVFALKPLIKVKQVSFNIIINRFNEYMKSAVFRRYAVLVSPLYLLFSFRYQSWNFWPPLALICWEYGDLPNRWVGYASSDGNPRIRECWHRGG